MAEIPEEIEEYRDERWCREGARTVENALDAKRCVERVYYAKLARGATFVAPSMVPHFHAIWGVRRSEEASRLSRNARAILRVLRHEWEMGTAEPIA